MKILIDKCSPIKSHLPRVRRYLAMFLKLVLNMIFMETTKQSLSKLKSLVTTRV
jgi:hypothetical protein